MIPAVGRDKKLVVFSVAFSAVRRVMYVQLHCWISEISLMPVDSFGFAKMLDVKMFIILSPTAHGGLAARERLPLLSIWISVVAKKKVL